MISDSDKLCGYAASNQRVGMVLTNKLSMVLFQFIIRPVGRRLENDVRVSAIWLQMPNLDALVFSPLDTKNCGDSINKFPLFFVEYPISFGNMADMAANPVKLNSAAVPNRTNNPAPSKATCPTDNCDSVS